jgi:hypothetical protein
MIQINIQDTSISKNDQSNTYLAKESNTIGCFLY